MGGVRLMRVRGIELRAHWSLAIIVGLVASSIALDAIPSEYPRWDALAAWSAGIGVALGVVASIALHEFAHSLVALRAGVRVPEVTLFAFGGIARLQDRPKRAADEFRISIAGPLMSLVIGIALVLASTFVTIDETASPAAVAALIALVLGQVNVVLAVFNCLPGVPLDGGRILHSAVWRATGSQARATAIAGRAGEVIGAGFVTIGLLMVFGWQVPLFGTGVGGAWLMLIGWFVAVVARAERTSAVVEEAAAHVPVARITRSLPVAKADTPLDEFADGDLLPWGAHALPVVDGDQIVGIASLRDVLGVAEPERSQVPVRSVMTPWDEVHTIDADSSIGDALREFSEHDLHQLPVVDGGTLVGFVHREDVSRWLQLHATGEQQGSSDSHASGDSR